MIGVRRKATDAQVMAAYQSSGSVWRAAEKLGMCGQSVHERLARLGAIKRVNKFTDAEKARLVTEYNIHADHGKLDDLAAEMNRTKQFICRQAGLLGLTQPRRRKPYSAETSSRNMIAWHSVNEHPRGALGMKHSDETRAKISAKSIASWAEKSEEQRSEITMKSMKTRVEKYGSVAPARPNTSWKAGWREIGGVRKYYRSRWEANYARYLEWLRARGEIEAWSHEPETFWFHTIKRGVRSYLPDFRVWENDGSSNLHEVKGWMDDRSKTTLKRMKKYHPSETIILIEKTAYESIENTVGRVIDGWEFKT